jgi:tetratricopeptide (TPR) repeat protein
VVSIEGEPGIGKTRLASEFLRWAAAQGADVLHGRAFEAAGRVPYQPLVDALRARVERENAPEDLLSDVWLAELSRLLPELQDRYPDLTRSTGDDAAARTRLFEAVARLVLAFAERGPVVLWLDDLQWADAASFDLLQYAGRRWARAPVLLLVCFRSDDLSTTPALTNWLAALARELPLLRQTLRPLTSEDTERLVRLLRGAGPGPDRDGIALPEPPPPAPVLEAVCRRLFAETGGHPFFLVETVRALLERGILRIDPFGGSLIAVDSGWADGVRDALPRGVQELIRGRLARLSATGRTVMLAAAVLGQGFAYEQLSRVAGVDEANALPALDDLLARRLLHETGGRYRFAHDRIREVAYAEAGAARRRLYHRRAFSVLQAEPTPPAELLRHALAANLGEEAFRFGVATGDDAMRLYAARDAIRHYELARHLAETGSLGVGSGAGLGTGELSAEDRHHLYLQLARAYELAAEYGKARAVYEALLTWAHETHQPMVECAALNRLARLAETDQLDVEAQASLLERALSIARASGDHVGLGETEWNLSRLSLYRLDLEAGRAHGERALALAHTHGQPEHVARNRNWLSIIELLAGRYADAEAHAEAARTAYAVLGDRVMEADSLVQMAAARTRSGHPQAGIAAARAAHALSQEIDNWAGQADAAKELALALLESGNYEEALRVAEAGLAATRAAGDVRTVLLLTMAYLGSIHRHLGELELARAVHEEGWAICRAVNIPLFTELLAAELCADNAESGEWAEAYAYASKASQERSRPAVYLGRRGGTRLRRSCTPVRPTGQPRICGAWANKSGTTGASAYSTSGRSRCSPRRGVMSLRRSATWRRRGSWQQRSVCRGSSGRSTRCWRSCTDVVGT